MSSYFLPYQQRWLADRSRIKIWEKSRRIGATYAQSYEDVEDVIQGRVPKVWFTSADESAAEEYIQYCEQWIKVFDVAAKHVGLKVVESENDIKTYTIELANGREIHGLSSNPKKFRSKGGKAIWDESAWHDNPKKMWAAIRPTITWGFPLRILSTHNGKQSLFYKFIQDVLAGRLNWSHHKTPIQLAVDEGLADKILGRTLTNKERQQWLDDERASVGDEAVWAQEYCCEPQDETTAFMTYDLIERISRDGLLLPYGDIKGDLFVGMDIARKRHLSVIWGIERLGSVKHTRFVKTLEKAPFHVQRDALFEVLSLPNMRRACIDATGLGMQLAEEAQLAFGRYRVEGVGFTSKSKEEMAYQLLRSAEDVSVLIPNDRDVREDLHSVKKITTASGNIRFDADETDKGHADRFWALALANHAASDYHTGPTEVRSRRRRQSATMTRGYD